jgi:hypothetical protein
LPACRSPSGPADHEPPAEPPRPAGSPIVDEQAFQVLIAGRAAEAVRMASYLRTRVTGSMVFARPLLGEVLHQAGELEELLDAYGARYNERWHVFRSVMAAGRLFAGVNYELLHVQHSAPAYRLLPIEGDFKAAMHVAIRFTGQVLVRVADRLLEQARRLGLPVLPTEEHIERYEERLPPGRLPRNRAAVRAVDAGATVTYLATAFLNLAAESEVLHVPTRNRPEAYPTCVPKLVSEEKLRHLQHRFHNMQSLYDTNVLDTDTEQQNPDLPVLRGHISVIHHLLAIGTEFAHYYERHIMSVPHAAEAGETPFVSAAGLLDVLMNYCLVYASRYLVAARDLAQQMLKQYAEIGSIDVPGPRYRGFHVRPSTLVAKIVRHYGSDVTMEMDGSGYDAANPMDIFRANEKISAQKRRWLTQQVCSLPNFRAGKLDADLVKEVRSAVLALAETNRVVIYERQLPVQGPEEYSEPKQPVQYVLDEIARLQATGVIDIQSDVTVTFQGDKRVLADLQLLAENGYGEDNFGNNIALPPQLAYLRR